MVVDITAQEASQLLPDWTATLHTTANGRKYKMFHGPRGETAKSFADMRRRAGLEPDAPGGAKRHKAAPSADAPPRAPPPPPFNADDFLASLPEAPETPSHPTRVRYLHLNRMTCRHAHKLLSEDKGRHAEAPERLDSCLRAAIAESAVVAQVTPTAAEADYASKMVQILYGQSVEARVGTYGNNKGDNPPADAAGSAAAVRASVCTALRAVSMVDEWRKATAKPAASTAVADADADTSAAAASTADSTDSTDSTAAAAAAAATAAASADGSADAPPPPPPPQTPRIFCAIRPPGHHACVGADACGFCLVNNVGVAMLEAYRRGFRRPAVVDFDLHLGDATNLLVESLNSRRSRLRHELRLRGVDVPEPAEGRPIAYYASVHMDNTYPAVVELWHRTCRCVRASDKASGGYDCTATQCHRHATPVPQLNHAFLAGFAAFGESLARFAPDVLFFSAGFDAHVDEHLCKGKLKGAGVHGPTYEQITRQLLRSVGPHVPCISMLEGGYAPAGLQDGLAYHLRGLATEDELGAAAVDDGGGSGAGGGGGGAGQPQQQGDARQQQIQGPTAVLVQGGGAAPSAAAEPGEETAAS